MKFSAVEKPMLMARLTHVDIGLSQQHTGMFQTNLPDNLSRCLGSDASDLMEERNSSHAHC